VTDPTIDGSTQLYLVSPYGGEAAGRVDYHGRYAATAGAVVVVRTDDHGQAELSWGYLFGPLAALPGQTGWLVEVVCAGSTPCDPASWSTTGRRWPLGPDPEAIVREVRSC
jgi:hypothetical protein